MPSGSVVALQLVQHFGQVKHGKAQLCPLAGPVKLLTGDCVAGTALGRNDRPAGRLLPL
jgi:hypothetical protein